MLTTPYAVCTHVVAVYCSVHLVGSPHSLTLTLKWLPDTHRFATVTLRPTIVINNCAITALFLKLPFAMLRVTNFATKRQRNSEIQPPRPPHHALSISVGLLYASGMSLWVGIDQSIIGRNILEYPYAISGPAESWTERREVRQGYGISELRAE